MTLLFALALTASAALAGWRASVYCDPMTDEIDYSLYLMSDARESPALLVIRIFPADFDKKKVKLIFTPDIYLFSNNSYQALDSKVLLRLDKQKPAMQTWKESNDPRAIFAADPRELFDGISAASRLVVRFTVDGVEYTPIFSLEGLSDALALINKDYAKRTGQKIDATAKKAPCKKCRGKKEIEIWEPCAECSGRGMINNRRCAKCVNSIKLGKLRKRISCPDCSPAPERYTRQHSSEIPSLNYPLLRLNRLEPLP